MVSLNRFEFIGRLANDPELRYTPSKQAIASFVVDVDNGENVTSFPIVASGQLGELCHEQLVKGSLVYLEGFLTTSKLELKETVHDDEIGDYDINDINYIVQVRAKKIELLGSNKPQKTSIAGNLETIKMVGDQLQQLLLLKPIDDKDYMDLLKIERTLASLDFERLDF
ncbi:MAG: single-stranded DNA-binding protein [Anaerolineales bacterium]